MITGALSGLQTFTGSYGVVSGKAIVGEAVVGKAILSESMSLIGELGAGDNMTGTLQETNEGVC